MDEFGVSLLGALAAGVLSFVSPCVLPIVPASLCYLGGTTFDRIAASPFPALRLPCELPALRGASRRRRGRGRTLRPGATRCFGAISGDPRARFGRISPPSTGAPLM
jgi:hypothetical protein